MSHNCCPAPSDYRQSPGPHASLTGSQAQYFFRGIRSIGRPQSTYNLCCQFLPLAFPHLDRAPSATSQDCGHLPSPLDSYQGGVGCIHLHSHQALKLPVPLLVYPTLNRSRLRAKLTSHSSPQRRTLVSPSHSSYKAKMWPVCSSLRGTVTINPSYRVIPGLPTHTALPPFLPVTTSRQALCVYCI